MFVDDIKLYHIPFTLWKIVRFFRLILMCFLNGQITGFYPSIIKSYIIGNAPYIGNYCLGRTLLEIVEPWHIQVDSKLKFHIHTGDVTKKAHRVLGLISKSFECKDRDVLIRLCTTLAIVKDHQHTPQPKTSEDPS